MGKIVSVQTQRFNLPLAEVLSDAKHGDHTHFELITATISLDDGTIGTGYTYTGGRGGHAILAMIDHDLIPQIVGRDASNVEAENKPVKASRKWPEVPRTAVELIAAVLT